MANILLASINYWPEETGIGPYSTGLAEHLADAGHRVTVMAGMPHYPGWKVWPEYQGIRRSEESHGGVRILRQGHYVPQRQSAVRRALYEGSFLANVAFGRTPSRPDAVIGVTPSLSGAVLARLGAAHARAAYGIVVQDLMHAAAAQSGITGGRRVAGITRHLEAWALERATVVAPVAEAFRPGLLALGVAPERIEVLPNWSHLRQTADDRDAVRASLGWAPGDWIVLHAGNMGLKQGLEQLVEGARVADRQQVPIRFVLMGDGSQRAILEADASSSRCVQFLPFVSEERLPDVLGAADVLVLSERSTVVDMSLPSKLTAYFAAGRPVVAAVHADGASARELNRAMAGVTTATGDPEGLVRAILELRERPEEARRLGDNGRQYAAGALSQFTAFERIDRLVARLLERTHVIRRSDPAI